MLPSFAGYYLPDSSPSDPKTFGQPGSSILSVVFAYIANSGLVEFGLGAFVSPPYFLRKKCSPVASARTEAVPLNRIDCVFRMIPKIQVARSDARRIVTLVKNPQAIWNRPVGELPTDSVRGLKAPMSRHFPIPLFLVRRSPVPALVRLLNSRPKSILKACVHVFNSYLDNLFVVVHRLPLIGILHRGNVTHPIPSIN